MRKIILFLVSAALIIFGIYRLAVGESLISVICLIAGCLLMTNLNIRADNIADSLIKAMNGKFPVLTYAFMDSSFNDGPDRPDVKYSSLYKLIEDDSYFYLFTSKASGYMFPVSSVRKNDSDENAVTEFKKFISEKSGLAWGRPLSLFTFSIKDALYYIRKK